MFKLNPEATTVGSSRVGTLHAAPRRLVETFGKPMKGDDYKVSGRYIFDADDGQVFTVYDYKYTSLYDVEYPSPKDFWASEKPVGFSIGSLDDRNVNIFIQWVENQIQAYSEPVDEPGTYKIRFTRTHYSCGTIEVKAKNGSEAKNIAYKMLDMDQICFANPYVSETELSEIIKLEPS